MLNTFEVFVHVAKEEEEGHSGLGKDRQHSPGNCLDLEAAFSVFLFVFFF